MNVRSVVLPKSHPLFSGGMVYGRVSLPCEPWLEPDAPRPPPAEPQKVFCEDGEAKILKAVQDGHTIFDVILHHAFGRRTGKVDERGRKILNSLLERGVITRTKDLTKLGQPYIWRMNNGGL